MGSRLGQHFLHNTTIARRIVEAACVGPHDIILEVGPGKGVLTHLLAKKAGRVIAVEKDELLVASLKNTFADKKNVTILHEDALKINNVKSIIQNPNYKIVANLPYYITSHFLRLFLENNDLRPQEMTLMIQKEVAERIVAKPPHMNLLALSVQAFGKPKILFRVGKGSFSPPPKVDSAVIQIANISGAFFKKHHIPPATFFMPIKKAFSQKRKMLKNSIGSMSEVRLLTYMEKKRPQEFSLEDWATVITNHIT